MIKGIGLIASRHCALALAALLLASCATFGSKGETKSQGAKVESPLKVGLYLDDGCRGNGPFQWARLIANSPQFELTLLDGKAIRDGRLSEVQLLLCPGGGGARQIAAMKPDGFMKVKKFVEDGGMYLGICAGSYNAMDREGRFGFLPYDYIQGAHGKLADLAVDFNEEAAKMLGIKAGQHVVRYNGGNVMKPTREASADECKVLAVFKSSVSNYGKEAHNFLDTPSVVYGKYGKGKVLASSFHPESYESTHDIALGYFKVLAGVQAVPEYPSKLKHPTRVGFMTLACVGPRATNEFLELDKDEALDVDIFTLHEVAVGSLRHYEVIIMPDGDESSYKRLFENEGYSFYKKQILSFLERGGRILASGNGGAYLPKHKNVKVLPVNESFVKYARN